MTGKATVNGKFESRYTGQTREYQGRFHSQIRWAKKMCPPCLDPQVTPC